MNRFKRIIHALTSSARGWVAERRLRVDTVTHLTHIIEALHQRVDELEKDIDEVRSDSRRVAELRILVEDILADRR